MVSSVGSGSTQRFGASVSAQDQIGMILKQVKTLRKKIADLQKQLMEATDPKVRMELMREIQDLVQMAQTLEQQITQIEMGEKRKAAHREQAQQEQKKQAAAK